MAPRPDREPLHPSPPPPQPMDRRDYAGNVARQDSGLARIRSPGGRHPGARHSPGGPPQGPAGTRRQAGLSPPAYGPTRLRGDCAFPRRSPEHRILPAEGAPGGNGLQSRRHRREKHREAGRPERSERRRDGDRDNPRTIRSSAPPDQGGGERGADDQGWDRQPAWRGAVRDEQPHPLRPETWGEGEGRTADDQDRAREPCEMAPFSPGDEPHGDDRRSDLRQHGKRPQRRPGTGVRRCR